MRACLMLGSLVFSKLSIVLAGDAKVAQMGSILQETIEGLNITSDVSLDDLTNILEPILRNRGHRIWVTKRIVAGLKTLGFNDEVIMGFLRRRRRDRVRQLRYATEIGKHITEHRNTRPENPSGRSRYMSARRKAETQAALDAEIKLIEKKMESIGLTFDDTPEEFVANYDVLRGEKLTRNSYGRIIHVMMQRHGKAKGWIKRYRLAIRRRSSQTKREGFVSSRPQKRKAHKVIPTYSAESDLDLSVTKDEQDGSDASNIDLEKNELLDATSDGEEPAWKLSPQDNDVNESIGATSSSHLKKPLHHFQLPYTWYRGELKNREKVAETLQRPYEIKMMEDNNDIDAHHQDAGNEIWSYHGSESDSLSDDMSDESQKGTERLTFAQKTYKGHQRPSIAFLSIRQ